MSYETPKATDMSRTENPTPTPTEIAAATCQDLLRERSDILTGLGIRGGEALGLCSTPLPSVDAMSLRRQTGYIADPPRRPPNCPGASHVETCGVAPDPLARSPA